MPDARVLQESFAAGEFDPRLRDRQSVAQFYASARLMENALPMPQGGLRRRDGMRFRAMQRGALVQYGAGTYTPSAPNGGTAAHATDGNPATYLTTTAPIGTAAAYVVLSVDCGTAIEAHVCDLRGLHFVGLPTGVESGAISLQSSTNGTAWTTRATINAGSAEYLRRLAAAPDAPLATARYWRVIVDNPTGVDFGSAVVSFYAFWLYRENGYTANGTPGDAALRAHTAADGTEYLLVASGENVDIFRAETGAWVAAADVPHTGDQFRAAKVSTYLDTLIFYHPDVAPYLVQRLGSDGDWRTGEISFDSVVAFPFSDGGADLAGGVNEVQAIRFDDFSTGDKFLFELNGKTSVEVTFGSHGPDNAAAIEAALEGLDEISSVTATHVSQIYYEVEFTGIDGKQPWPILVVSVITGSGIVTVTRKQTGQPDTAPLWGGARGYPACGAFYQGRHWMGGFRARPDVIAASRTGALFDFAEDADPVASSPIVAAPNLDEQVRIVDIYPGRHLQIFTSAGELYVPNEPITVDNIGLKATTRHGSSGAVSPVDVQGGTLFIDRNGAALREYLYDYTQEAYTAEPISILAGHLVAQPRAMTLRRARNPDEPRVLFLANTGTDRSGAPVPAAMAVIDRAQQVTAFARIVTDGTLLAFEATQRGETFALVRRDLAGVAWHYVEQLDQDAMSDCSVQVEGSGSSVSLGAFPWLEGQTVAVHGDGVFLGMFEVDGLAIDLGDQSFSEAAEIGLRQVPRVVLHPFKGKGGQSPTMNKQRIHTVLVQMEDTGALSVAAADGATPRPVSLRRWGDIQAGASLSDVLFSGSKRISAAGRWQIEPVVTITQEAPMPIYLVSVTYDVRF